MPAQQAGSVERHNGSYRVRWYNEHGQRRAKSGFSTKTEARSFLRPKLEEVEALRRGDERALRRREMPTLNELCDEYLAQHSAEPNTMKTIHNRLKRSRAAFGDVRVDRLAVAELRAWRKTLPERSAQAYVKVLSQVLNYGIAVGVLDANPVRRVPNPSPKRREVQAFGSLDELTSVAAELPQPYRPIPIFVALTGLRPSEWIALERRDVDGDLLYVRRVFTDGMLKDYGKQAGSIRAVPLPALAVAALDELPPRIDTPLLFPSQRRSSYIDLKSWRKHYWDTAVRATGLERRTPYALRHTYASLAIAAGVSLFELARFMGTSVTQIDKTYGHLLPDAHARTRTALDAFLASAESVVVEAR